MMYTLSFSIIVHVVSETWRFVLVGIYWHACTCRVVVGGDIIVMIPLLVQLEGTYPVVATTLAYSRQIVHPILTHVHLWHWTVMLRGPPVCDNYK
jgi:hypothetical protein